MISRSEKIRLSVFLITAGALIIIAIIVLAGLRLSQKSDTYYVRFDESVSGLEVGAQVKYNGVRVGQVVDIRIDDKNLDATIGGESRLPGKLCLDITCFWSMKLSRNSLASVCPCLG